MKVIITNDSLKIPSHRRELTQTLFDFLTHDDWKDSKLEIEISNRDFKGPTAENPNDEPPNPNANTEATEGA